MSKFTVNGKTYFTKELTFEYLVALDKNDIKVTNVTGIAAVNCFFMYCSGLSEEEASKEITNHVINGGKLDDIIEAYSEALNESGFFRSLMEQAAERQEKVEPAEEKSQKKSRKEAVTE